MARCLPRFLLISIGLIILGFGLLWLGLSREEQGQQNYNTPAPPSAYSATEEIAGDLSYVSKVVDGDTIVINGNLTVRLLGIDTPETKDPRRPVGCYGKEASNETSDLLLGEQVMLETDVSDKDKYGRLLRYVFLQLENEGTLFVNDYLVREGFAKVLTYPPDVKYSNKLRDAEMEAKEEARGLWGKCY